MTGYAFYKEARDGDTVTLENGARYQYQKAKNRWVVKSVFESDGCPRFDAVATQYKDYGNPNEQIVITWFSHGNQAGNQGYSEVRLCNFLREIDTSGGWLSIDGNKHMIYRPDELSGDPVYIMLSSEGDLTHYIGSTVEVHACEEE
jgi:hypothetical protein